MIPKKKKSLEEIAALREELGIPEKRAEPKEQEPAGNETTEIPAPETSEPAVSQDLQDDQVKAIPRGQKEPAVHLDVSVRTVSPRPNQRPPSHSLRKKELPLAPPPPDISHKTDLPKQRHDSRDIAEIRKREALAKLSAPQTDPALHLKMLTAHPVLLIATYLMTLGAAASAWISVVYFTPLALLVISSLMTTYIYVAKKRSRHHSAILTAIIIMTATFGSLRYFPFFSYAT